MKTMVWTLCVVAGVVSVVPSGAKAAEKKQIRVLLITGRDVPTHPWRETTPVLREHLEKTRRFGVVVCEEPLVLESSALEPIQAIIDRVSCQGGDGRAARPLVLGTRQREVPIDSEP